RLDMRQRLRIDPVLRGGQAGARRVATEVEVQSDSSATRDPSIAEKHAPVWALMARASIRAAVRLAGRIRAGLAALLRLLFFLFVVEELVVVLVRVEVAVLVFELVVVHVVFFFFFVTVQRYGSENVLFQQRTGLVTRFHRDSLGIAPKLERLG